MQYYDIYKKRLERYGTDCQSRIYNQRIESFENFLNSSVSRIDFEVLLTSEEHPGVLERYRESNTQFLGRLLTRKDLLLEPGTLFSFLSKNGELQSWMIYYLETIKDVGYNKYVILRTNGEINWIDSFGKEQSSLAFFVGSATAKLIDQMMSSSRGAKNSIYTEDNSDAKIILPFNENLEKENYLEVSYKGIKKAFTVSGLDFYSTPGIEYVTIKNNLIRENNFSEKEQDDNILAWLEAE